MDNSTIIPPPTEEHDTRGFVAYQIANLPIGIRAVLSLVCIVLGLGMCSLAPYAARWGTHWGTNKHFSKAREGEALEERRKSKFRPAGGVLGIFTGGLGAAYTILLLAFAVLNTQDDPSFSPWAILAVSLVSAAIGATLGGRWKALSRLFLTYIGTISFALLLSTSFRIKAKLGRLIVFTVLFIITFVTSFIFSIIPRSSLNRISNRVAILLSTITGAWLVCAIGIDIFTKTGLLDAATLLASQGGIFKDGHSTNKRKGDNGADENNVVRWNDGKCKGLIAGIWLLTVFGTAFQQWRYSVIGDDSEESWNTYLGSLLSDEKNLITRARSSNNIGTRLTVLDSSNRAGIFSKAENWFMRLFTSSSERKRRMLPATYVLPPEQVPQAVDGNFHQASHGVYSTPGWNAENEEVPKYICNMDPDAQQERRMRAPARYDSFAYSAGGLGLYDAEVGERGACYPSHEESSSFSSGVYDDTSGLGRRAHMLPTYTPESYCGERTGQVVHRNTSEPSFQSVPKYSSARMDGPDPPSETGQCSSVHAGDTMDNQTVLSQEAAGGFGYGMFKEPEELDTLPQPERQSFQRPLSSSTHFTDVRSTLEEQVRPVPIPATPSLVHAIKRVSQAQAQARQYRLQEQQAQLSLVHQGSQATTPFPEPLSSLKDPSNAMTQSSSRPRIPESERTALRQAAIRRQTSADWWAEVERKANEQAVRERSVLSSTSQRASYVPNVKAREGMKGWGRSPTHANGLPR